MCWKAPNPGTAARSGQRCIPITAGVCGAAAPIRFGENEIDFVCAHVDPSAKGEYCCIPILAHGETIGLLHLDFGDEREPRGDELHRGISSRREFWDD